MLRLSDENREWIREHFPEENLPDGRPGREPVPVRRVLEAVLWILNTGAQLAVSTHAANHHEVTLAQISFDFYMIEAKPDNLIGDRAYDSDELNQGTERKRHRHDRPAPLEPHQGKDAGRASSAPLSSALARRALLCLDSVAKLSLVRREYHAENFLDFVQLASINILLRRF